MNSKIISEFNALVDQMQAEYINAESSGDVKEITRQKYRLQSTKRALQEIKKIDFKIQNSFDIVNIPGIGKGTLQRIDEILQTGRLSEIKKPNVKDKISQTVLGIQELSKVYGIGEKKAHMLVTKYNIKSVAELKKSYNTKKIDLDSQILLGLKYYGIVDETIPRKEITITKKFLHDIAHTIDEKLKITICGSYRRGKSTSGDIDVLIYHPDIKTSKELNDPIKYGFIDYIKAFVLALTKNGFLLDHITDKKYTKKYMGFCKYKLYPVRRIDIRFIPYKSVPPALVYFTGPKELNIMMRKEAIKRNMILNEYGLYKEDKDGARTMVKINSEEGLFEKLGMDYLTPVEREQYAVHKR